MTRKETEKLEKKLVAAGYVKNTVALSSTESFGYFKSGDVRYDEYGEKIIGYQIEYRFWDWSVYGNDGKNEFGVDVIIINSGKSRVDLELTSTTLEIDRIEKIADSFNEFCREHSIGQF